MEKRVKVIPKKVVYICDNCGESEMETNESLMLLTYPASWRYNCFNCGHSCVMEGEYPRIEYVEEEVRE